MVMIKTISSRLTAHFRPDGSHLERYLVHKATITKSLCEDLILHNQVLIPTTDYLTAAGLIQIIGEVPFVRLLEGERLKFIRTRCVVGYGRGTGRDGGLLVLADPTSQRPQDAPIEDSVAAALSLIGDQIQDRRKVLNLITQNSYPEETSSIVQQVTREAIEDFKKTKLWRPQYEFPDSTLLALPGVAKMQVRVIAGEHDPKRLAVDTLLSLVLYNSDVLLAQRYNCQAISSFCPIGDLIDLKLSRSGDRSAGFWELIEVNGIPDLSQADFTQPGAFDAFEAALAGSKAEDFRSWFHSLQSFDRTQILKEYISVLQQVPWTSRLPGKAFRFVTTTGLGLVPVVGPIVGAIAGAIDAFVIDQLFRKKSPKFFIDELNKVAGVLRNEGPQK